MISERQTSSQFLCTAGRIWGWQANDSGELWNKPIPPGNPWQGEAIKTSFLSIHICWGGKRGCAVRGWRGLWWDFPPHDTAAFSACVNKASLNSLIILCKLQDQGTYWKHATKCSAVRLWPVSSKAFPSASTRSTPNWFEPWYILTMSCMRLFLSDYLISEPPPPSKNSNYSSHHHSILYNSSSHELILNESFCLTPFPCSLGRLYLSDFINKTCIGAFKWHSSYSYQHNATLNHF